MRRIGLAVVLAFGLSLLAVPAPLTGQSVIPVINRRTVLCGLTVGVLSTPRWRAALRRAVAVIDLGPLPSVVAGKSLPNMG
jgi:hypothetical protein